MITLKRNCRGEEVKKLQRALHLVDDGIFGPLTEEGVKHFQRNHGLTVDGIVGAKTWAAIEAYPAPSSCEGDGKTFMGVRLKKSVRNIKRIILHCTATPEGKDYSVDKIREWHTKPEPAGRGWSDIGYHYVIYRDGSLHVGRDVNLSGAHTKDYNTTSIGIVYVGGLTADAKKSKDTRTDAQNKTLHALVAELKKMYPGATVHGHSEFANKSCPCFDVKKEVWMLLIGLFLFLSCSTEKKVVTEYVPYWEKDTEYIFDTVQVKETIEKETNTVIREVDSTAMAEFGIRLEGQMKAFLVQQMAKEKRENDRANIVYVEKERVDSIPFPVYIDKIIEVEPPSNGWKYFLWGVGTTIFLALLMIFRRKVASFLKIIWKFARKLLNL